MKFCRKCQTNKFLDLFGKNKKYKDGLEACCKDCHSKYIKEWRSNNPEKNKIYSSTKRAWKVANLDKYKEYSTVWKLFNNSKKKPYDAHRRAAKRKATPGWAETEFEKFTIEEIYSLARLRTRLTGIVHHVDHIVPIKSKYVQGFHCSSNLQILEAKANIAKGNRFWPNMPDYAARSKVVDVLKGEKLNDHK